MLLVVFFLQSISPPVAPWQQLHRVAVNGIHGIWCDLCPLMKQSSHAFEVSDSHQAFEHVQCTVAAQDVAGGVSITNSKLIAGVFDVSCPT